MNILREYRARDFESVITIFRKSVHETCSHDYSAAQLNAWAPDSLDIDAWSARLNNGGVFIVEQKDSIVGFTRVDGHGYLDLLYVHPDYQRQGIGKMLIERVISWASEHNIKQLVSDVSITARPIFELFGFKLLAKQTVERHGIFLINFRMKIEISI